MSNRIAFVAATLFLTGCPVGDVTEDNFADKYAQATCSSMKKCNPISFYVDPDDLGIEDDDYADSFPVGDMDDCIDFYTEMAEDILDAADDADCELDEDNATDCLNGGSGSCKTQAENIEDTQEACEDMIDC